jgi:peroxiredoxin
MQKIAKEMDFSFPYLMDKTQEVAKAYGDLIEQPIEGICFVGPCPVVATWLIASNKCKERREECDQ